MSRLTDLQTRLADVQRARETARTEARALALRVDALQTRRAEALRISDAVTAAALEQEIAETERAAGERRATAGQLGDAFASHALEVLDIEIDDRIGQLDDHVPVLLFPVRLETKFHREAGQTQLRVRIFPDDILVSTHDPLLTDNERAAGGRYWAARAEAAGFTGEERRRADATAWATLATAFGGPRARYIARRTRPGVPQDEPSRPPHLSAPPRARLLPDQFIVMAFDQQGNTVAQQTGRLIPDVLQLGPDPGAPLAELLRDPSGRLAANPKLEWLFNFERAVEAGMAVTLMVPPPFDAIGFHRVVAIGVKASLSPEAGAAAVEELFADQRFTKGIDIVRQGAPTNNTDGTPSAFTTDLSADEALVAQEVEGLVATAVLDHAGKSDAQRLAEALGLSFDTISDWPNAAEAFDIADALAMNRALWPATFGIYLRALVAGRLTDGEKAAIERFFLTYVTGRSLLPAIRVGTQPYGVLTTSNLMAWTEAVPANPAEDVGIVVKGVQWFRSHFEAIAGKSDPALAQLGTGPDSVATSLRVIGQLASSTSFVSRKAVTDEWAWNTLAFEGLAPNVRTLWWNERERVRNENFAALGLDRAGLPLGDLFFFDAADPLVLPVVDLDPAVPLSETEGLSRFDGTNNYIQWLLNATDEQLRREAFVDDQGAAIAPPRALLYRLLQMAWVTRLTTSAHDLVVRIRPEVIAASGSPAVVNVSGVEMMTDEFATRFDSRKLGLSSRSRALGELLLGFANGSEAGEPLPEALPVMSHRDALARLAIRPTAVLERLFAEHVDLGSYRLDAWLTGLSARRLDHMRRRDDRARGIYLAAFGYVESLVPASPAIPVDPQTLPEPFRNAPVVERTGNGGFVHAPSLNQAVTAAVLRNAYLTHAEPDHREVMSVNLTSRRTRDAMSMIEGIRAGQDLAALLGYQLERGLHERHPGIELDEFIYVLRARFPLVSRRLTAVPADTPAEVIEARNVVDGYDLVEHVRRNPAYPHGLDGLPGSGVIADAIRSEFERLDETLDSIADLMLAESVHQAVQSNVDRARGVIGAIANGEMPPIPDVAQTPRSGRAFTERVTLHLADSATGWLASPSPRARTNPRLNSWLARQLPPPQSIGFEVRLPAGTVITMTLDHMAIDAIDLVMMSGDRHGDGTSELERHLADRARSEHGVADEAATSFAPLPPPSDQPTLVVDIRRASSATPLATLWPHLRALRRLITSARGLHAQDFRLVTDEIKANPSNPKGYRLTADGDFAELPDRIRETVQALKTVADSLEAALNGPPSPALLRTQLRAAVLHGIGEALPRSSNGDSANAAQILIEQGRFVLPLVRARVQRATEALAPLPTVPPLADPVEEQRRRAARLEQRWRNVISAAYEALGASYPVQPLFAFDADAKAEIDARLAHPVEADPLALETWLQRLTRVRPRLADVAVACTAAFWSTGHEPRAVPVQLPLRVGDPWIGAEWTTPPADGEILSVMTLDAPASVGGDLEGLLIDEWTETVPTARETTGLAFHFDRPNAVAPQALLLAVPPAADGRWQWSELVAIVLDTFRQARLRAVEPDLVTASPLFQILPTAVMPFTHGDERPSRLLVRDLVAIR